MKNLLLLSLLLSGCVVKYGELPQPGAAEVGAVAELSAQESELLSLRAAAAGTDVDRRDRIDAALELIRLAESPDFSALAVRDYLDRLIAIESRAQPEPLLGLGADEAVEEEVLEGEPVDEGEPRQRSEAAPVDGAGVEEALILAREALAGEDYAAAIQTLEPLRDAPQVGALWQEAIDGFVHSERERAGEQFLEARELPAGRERAEAIRAVLTRLTELSERYPESAYQDALERNIGLVKRALEEAEAAPTGGE